MAASRDVIPAQFEFEPKAATGKWVRRPRGQAPQPRPAVSDPQGRRVCFAVVAACVMAGVVGIFVMAADDRGGTKRADCNREWYAAYGDMPAAFPRAEYVDVCLSRP